MLNHKSLGLLQGKWHFWHVRVIRADWNMSQTGESSVFMSMCPCIQLIWVRRWQCLSQSKWWSNVQQSADPKQIFLEVGQFEALTFYNILCTSLTSQIILVQDSTCAKTAGVQPRRWSFGCEWPDQGGERVVWVAASPSNASWAFSILGTENLRTQAIVWDRDDMLPICSRYPYLILTWRYKSRPHWHNSFLGLVYPKWMVVKPFILTIHTDLLGDKGAPLNLLPRLIRIACTA